MLLVVIRDADRWSVAQGEARLSGSGQRAELVPDELRFQGLRPDWTGPSRSQSGV